MTTTSPLASQLQSNWPFLTHGRAYCAEWASSSSHPILLQSSLARVSHLKSREALFAHFSTAWNPLTATRFLQVTLSHSSIKWALLNTSIGQLCNLCIVKCYWNGIIGVETFCVQICVDFWILYLYLIKEAPFKSIEEFPSCLSSLAVSIFNFYFLYFKQPLGTETAKLAENGFFPLA